MHPLLFAHVAFDAAQGFGHRHLQHQRLVGPQRILGNAVPLWMMVATRESDSSSQPVCPTMRRRRFTAFTPASSPWSMTFTASSGPTMARVICRPPDPQPRDTGISREPNGTW